MPAHQPVSKEEHSGLTLLALRAAGPVKDCLTGAGPFCTRRWPLESLPHHGWSFLDATPALMPSVSGGGF